MKIEENLFKRKLKQLFNIKAKMKMTILLKILKFAPTPKLLNYKQLSQTHMVREQGSAHGLARLSNELDGLGSSRGWAQYPVKKNT